MRFYFSLFGSLILGSSLGAATFQVDPVHSQVAFKIPHMKIATVSGHFRDFNGSFTTDDKSGELTGVQGTVKTASIDTGNQKRDGHLRSADFFDAEKYPEMKFVSEKLKIKAGSKGKMAGKLTIRDVTKDVEFEIEFPGQIKDPSGNEIGAFSASLPINRYDYGLKWNKALEAGGFVVGETLTINLNVEGKKPSATPAEKPSTGKK